MTSRDGLGSKFQRNLTYVARKTSRSGIDADFEQRLCERAATYLATTGDVDSTGYDVVPLSEIDASVEASFVLVRDDIYRRFVADEGGSETDSFGRRGAWIPRGSMLYLDTRTDWYVKLFDEYFCEHGEGRFLRDALDRNMYEFLCPGLRKVIVDERGTIRGYAIEAGEPLTRYEFERYVGGCLRELVCAVTAFTGLYFNDLEYHNVVRRGDELSFIDLESVLPVEWFGTDTDFASEHLDIIDIGWPIQSKWNSPRWYRRFLKRLTGAVDDAAPDGDD